MEDDRGYHKGELGIVLKSLMANLSVINELAERIKTAETDDEEL